MSEEAPQSEVNSWAVLEVELQRAQEALQQPFLDRFVCSKDPSRQRTVLDLILKAD